jgi:hypothetical protein
MSTPRRVKPSLIVPAAVLTVSAMLALPASASFDHHFTVAIGVRSERVFSNHHLKSRLVDPRHRHSRVGRLWGTCKSVDDTSRAHCELTVHLNGQIGGFGSINVKGKLGPHDHRVSVVGGSHDFRGVTGKLIDSTVHRHGPDLHIYLKR